MVLTVYHDLNVYYYIMNKNIPLHPIPSYYQMCISKRQKKNIIINNIMRQPKPVS